jgi:hypothetical protein
MILGLIYLLVSRSYWIEGSIESSLALIKALIKKRPIGHQEAATRKALANLIGMASKQL